MKFEFVKFDTVLKRTGKHGLLKYMGIDYEYKYFLVFYFFKFGFAINFQKCDSDGYYFSEEK